MRLVSRFLPALALLASTWLAAPELRAQSPPPPLEARINAALELSQSAVFPLLVDELPGGSLRAHVSMYGTPITLLLAPHSVRSATGFQLLVQGPGGRLTATPPAPEITLRGTVLEIPGSRVAASYDAQGRLHARLRIDAIEGDFWIDSAASVLPDAPNDLHVLYNTADVTATGKSCGSTTLPLPGLEVQKLSGAACGVGLCIAQLACDTDFEYYQAYGSNVNTVQNRIESIINSMNMQYEVEVNIEHVITSIVVRTTAADPYSGTDMGTLLNQLQAQWTGPLAGTPHDAAQLFSGRDTSGGVIGLAWLSAICSSLRYSVVENFSSNFSCLTDLSAHELGHNWGAPHCTCPSNTMNPSITCTNSFAATSITSICNFAAGLGCLNAGGPPQADFTSDKTGGPAPLGVRFFDTSDGAYTSLLWDFGDGSTSTETDPGHTYTVPGTYDVTLTVSGLAGSDAVTKQDYIQVSDEIIDFTDLGGGTSGFVGVPRLFASGPLVPGTLLEIQLEDAIGNHFALAWMSFASTPLQALGGTIYSNPPANQFLFATNLFGAIYVPVVWPAGVPAGTELYLQFLIQDFSSVHDIVLSNGITATVP